MSNKNKIFSGTQDIDLCEEGIEQLKQYKNTYNYPKTDIYVSSPLKRCIQTFDILYPEETIYKINENFKEIFFGDIEGKPFSHIENFEQYFEKIFKNENITNNELFNDFEKRVLKGLKEVINDLQTNNFESATIICHSMVIRAILKKAYNLEVITVKTLPPPKNGKAYLLEIDIKDDNLIFNKCEELK